MVPIVFRVIDMTGAPLGLAWLWRRLDAIGLAWILEVRLYHRSERLDLDSGSLAVETPGSERLDLDSGSLAVETPGLARFGLAWISVVIGQRLAGQLVLWLWLC